MKKFTFTRNTISANGKTFPADYSITPAGTVFVFVDTGAPERTRVRFNPDHEEYAAARAAALDARNASERPENISSPAAVPTIRPADVQPATVPEGYAPTTIDGTIIAVSKTEDITAPAAVQQPAAAPVEQPAAVQDPEETPADGKQARGPVPEKTFVGDSISGNGWKIIFDGATSRTRVIFDSKPTDAARAALDKAGFFFSASMNSWNKKLTFKAYRAAQALSGELSALYA